MPAQHLHQRLPAPARPGSKSKQLLSPAPADATVPGKQLSDKSPVHTNVLKQSPETSQCPRAQAAAAVVAGEADTATSVAASWASDSPLAGLHTLCHPLACYPTRCARTCAAAAPCRGRARAACEHVATCRNAACRVRARLEWARMARQVVKKCLSVRLTPLGCSEYPQNGATQLTEMLRWWSRQLAHA